MNSITLLIKPASGLCNMRCRYCFYEDVTGSRSVRQMGLMQRSTAEILIRKALEAAAPGGTVHFLFQGGEPTLAGLGFFRDFLALEDEYAKPGVAVSHGLQTNGLNLNSDWAAFLRDEGFLVGVSVDANRALHDRFRPDAEGRGTWDRVTGAIRLLEENRVETNLLCVVTGPAAKRPQRLYHSLLQLGSHPLQLIPCLDPLAGRRGSMDYSLTPQVYGKFLCQIFDCWYRDWKNGRYVSIRNFDDYLRILLRQSPSACAASGSCGHYLAVEADGSLYPCDFYALDPWYLGNIQEVSIGEALSCSGAQAFFQAGQQRPAVCAQCRFDPLCRGGCMRDWTETGGNYYCDAYRAFFPYAIGRLEEMAAFYCRNQL